MAKRSENQGLFNLETPAKPQGPVECLGMTAFGLWVPGSGFLVGG